MVHILLQQRVPVCVYLIGVYACLVPVVLAIGVLGSLGLLGLFRLSLLGSLSLVLFPQFPVGGLLRCVSFAVLLDDFFLLPFDFLLQFLALRLLLSFTQVRFLLLLPLHLLLLFLLFPHL